MAAIVGEAREALPARREREAHDRPAGQRTRGVSALASTHQRGSEVCQQVTSLLPGFGVGSPYRGTSLIRNGLGLAGLPQEGVAVEAEARLLLHPCHHSFIIRLRAITKTGYEPLPQQVTSQKMLKRFKMSQVGSEADLGCPRRKHRLGLAAPAPPGQRERVLY